MAQRFENWLACPECDGRDVSIMAHKTDIVVECYSCKEVSEFTVGRDIPIHNLDMDAIDEIKSDQIGD